MTPLLLAVVALVLVLIVGVADVGILLAGRLQAGSAADAAALAAAPVTFRPFGAEGGPAAEARRFAVANGSRLVRCRCPIDRSWEPRRVTVTVERTVSLLGFGSLSLRAESSAEFTPSKLLGVGGSEPDPDVSLPD